MLYKFIFEMLVCNVFCVNISKSDKNKCHKQKFPIISNFIVHNNIETSGSRHYRPTPSSAYAIHLVLSCLGSTFSFNVSVTSASTVIIGPLTLYWPYPGI